MKYCEVFSFPAVKYFMTYCEVFSSQPASSVQAVPWVVNAGDRLRLFAACLVSSYQNFVVTGTRRSSSRQTTTRMVSYPGWRLRTCSCRPASLRISSLTFGTFATCGRWATLLTFQLFNLPRGEVIFLCSRRAS